MTANKNKIISFILLLSFMVFECCGICNYASAANENIALKKEAFASSQYSDGDQYAPFRVNDGSYFELWSDGFVTLTGPVAGYYYIAVDLGEQYILNTIKGYPRIDFDDSVREHNWIFQISNTRDFSDAVTVGTIKETCPYGGNFTINVEEDKPYRYVRIASPYAFFTVGEMEVFGEKYDPATMSGGSVLYDSEEELYNGAASVCSALGIIESTGRSTFEGEKLFTRANAAKAVSEIMHYGSPLQKTNTFKDVNEDYWAYDDIYAVLENGIISRAEYFRPDDFVTVRELSSMLISALGYEEYAIEKGGWPLGIDSTAKELGFLKKLSVSRGDYLTRGMAAQMFYNALNSRFSNRVDYRKNLVRPSDYTVLEEMYNMEIVEGIMTENCVSSLIRPLSKNSKHIAIDGKSYLDSEDMMALMLGKRVGALVEIDTQKVVVGWEDTRINEITKINGSDYVSCSGGMFRYENEKGSVKRVKFNEDEVYVLKNHEALPDWTYSDFICPDGRLEFIDNDEDSMVDVVMIYEPQTMIGGYITSNDGDVVIVDQSGAVLRVDDAAWIKLLKNGKIVTPGKYTENDVIKVYKSNNDGLLLIEATNNSVSGEVESISSEMVTINGQEFEISQYYNNLTDEKKKIKLGITQRFLLDERDRLICAIIESSAREDIVGFVCKVRSISEYETIEVTIYNEDGNFATSEVAERITIDGVNYKKNKLYDLLANDVVDIDNKIVRAYYNESEELREVEVLEKSDRTLGSDIVYIKGGDGIYNRGWLVQPLKASTPCFTIPKIGDSYAYKGYEKYYAVNEVHTHLPDLAQIYNPFDFYNLDENGYPEVGVRYISISIATNTGVNAVNSNSSSGPMLVKKVKSAINKDGEVTNAIEFVDLASGQESKAVLSIDVSRVLLSDSIQAEKRTLLDANKDVVMSRMTEEDLTKYSIPVDDLKTGDIVRAESQHGEVIALERTFQANSGQNGVYERSDDGTYFSAGGDYPEFPAARYRLVYGLAEGIKGDIMSMTTCKRPCSDEMFIQNISFRQVPRLFVVRGRDIEVYYGEDIPANLVRGQETILYTSGGQPRAVVLYAK